MCFTYIMYPGKPGFIRLFKLKYQVIQNISPRDYPITFALDRNILPTTKCKQLTYNTLDIAFFFQ